jgi:recombination protein RecR
MPGIGRRTATRLAFHLLKAPPDETAALASAIGEVNSRIGCCECCWQLTDVQPCRICADQTRDGSCVLVVEQPRDLMSIEATGLHRGVYHVLTGRLDPLGGVGPDDLTIAGLVDRVDDPDRNAGRATIEEVILGLSPTLEGDTTAHYISEAMSTRNVRVTRLARGLPSGSSLEFATPAMLADAILGRAPRE